MHLLGQPAAEPVPVPADRIPGLVEVVVAGGVAQRVRGMRSAGRRGHVADHPGGQHDRPRLGRQLLHDLLDGDDRPPGAEHGFLLHPGDPPQLDVPGPVGTLGVDDRHVRVQRGHGGQPLAGERAGDRPDGGLPIEARQAFQAGAAVAAQDRERHSRGACHVAVGHPRVAVLLQLKWSRPRVFHRVPEAVQRAHPGVAAPGEDEPAGTARPDELVIEHIGGHPDQGQVTPALPDDFPPGRERDEVSESFHGDRIPVVDGPCDGLGQ